MAMKLPGGVGVVKVETAPAAQKHVSAKPGDGQAGEYTQPGIELLGHDVARGIESNGAKSKNARGMRGGDDQAEQQGMPRCSPRADQVGSDDGLAVAGLKRVQCSQSQGDKAGGDEEPETHAAGGDQLSEGAARGRLLVGLEAQRLSRSAEWACVTPGAGLSTCFETAGPSTALRFGRDDNLLVANDLARYHRICHPDRSVAQWRDLLFLYTG